MWIFANETNLKKKSTVWVSFEWINHNMRNNRICYVWLPAGRSYVFPQLWIFSWGLQPHPTLSRGVVVLWFRLPTQSFRLHNGSFHLLFDMFFWDYVIAQQLVHWKCLQTNYRHSSISADSISTILDSILFSSPLVLLRNLDLHGFFLSAFV